MAIRFDRTHTRKESGGHRSHREGERWEVHVACMAWGEGKKAKVQKWIVVKLGQPYAGSPPPFPYASLPYGGG